MHRRVDHLAVLTPRVLERGAPRGFGRRVAGNRAERLRVVRALALREALDRLERDHVARRRFRHLREDLGVGDRVDRVEAVALGDPFEPIEREIA